MTRAKVSVGHAGRLFLATPPLPFAEARASVRALEEMKAQRLWEASDVESGPSESGDDLDLIAPADPVPCCVPDGNPSASWRHAEKLRLVDAEVLRRRYGDAVLAMSSPVDLATATVRLGASNRVNGPLWEACRAAADEELPNVLCHFWGQRFPLSGVYLRVSPPGSRKAPAQDVEFDEELEEIRRQFDRIQREIHKPQEEDPDDRSRSGLTSGTDADKTRERFRQCLGCKVQEAMLQESMLQEERAALSTRAWCNGRAARSIEQPGGHPPTHEHVKLLARSPRVTRGSWSSGIHPHRGAPEAMLQKLDKPATAAAQSVHQYHNQEVSASQAEASYLSTVEKARAQATMLMLTGIVVAHDNMRFVVPSTAANVAWYKEPHLPSAQESYDERMVALGACGTSNGTSTGSFSNAHYQTATMCSFARTRRPRRPKLSAKAAKDEKANDASIAPNCAPAGSLAATDYQSPATASMIRAGRFPSFGPKRDLLFHPATTKEA